ncbi:MAG: ParB/RepB/Spo0J family partition protein, partial [Candidatus Subteraquimicrobiales bacterium]|nr:ParB/RepB/Spo0J family partition protein [Candidatus Subteraquimicrobiales bacterium]
MIKRGLGKGLGALIPIPDAGEVRIEEILIDNIIPNPNQPRKHFDPQAFEELVSSIKEFGLIQPIVVRTKENNFEIIAGERRWRAAKEAGLATIPAIIRNSTDTESLEMALIENIQRENLNAVEEATAYHQLIEDFDLTQGELASKLGKSRAAIANTLRLLDLPEEIKSLIAEGNL